MERSKVWLLIKDIAIEEEVNRKVTSKLLNQDNTDHLWLYKIKRIRQLPHDHVSKPTSPLSMITTHHATIMPL